jgi:hypothetical protein
MFSNIFFWGNDLQWGFCGAIYWGSINFSRDANLTKVKFIVGVFAFFDKIGPGFETL